MIEKYGIDQVLQPFIQDIHLATQGLSITTGALRTGSTYFELNTSSPVGPGSDITTLSIQHHANTWFGEHARQYCPTYASEVVVTLPTSQLGREKWEPHPLCPEGDNARLCDPSPKL